MTPTVIGRLAPSPTGAQHVGNARTFLIAWLSIRAQGGRLLLRIEDIDSPRIKPGAADQILEDLRWLGLDWDGEPVIQTQRLPLYRDFLQRLQAQELAYPCTCTRRDVELAASAPHAEHDGPIYPGTCAGRRAGDALTLDRRYSWRFRLQPGNYDYEDLLKGKITFADAAPGGDFVLWKNDGTPAYQLAVVVDDALMGITEVIRGDDLVFSTPRQLALYRALGLSPPNFGHVPLVVGPDGRRLAKRHGDTRLSSLRAAGVASEMLIGLLAWSCGWLSEIRPVTPRELLPLFDPRTIPATPLVLTSELLRRVGYEIPG